MACCGLFLAAIVAAAGPAPNRPAPAASPTATATPLPADATVEDDPTSGVKTLNVQTTYTGATYGPGNFTVTQVIMRLTALRIGKSLARVTLPRLQTINGLDSGFGDMQAFYLFQERTHTGATFVGLFAQFPTATTPLFGTGKWLVGPAVAHIFTYVPRREIAGILVQSGFSVAGQAHRANQSVITFLPFGARFIGGGWFLKLPEAPWVFDLQRGASLIPLGLGIGRVLYAGGQPYLLAVSGEATILHANVVNAPKNTVRLTLTVYLR